MSDDDTKTRYAELETRLGHTFRDAALCETAMTHTSWVNEAGQPRPRATTSGSNFSATRSWIWSSATC